MCVCVRESQNRAEREPRVPALALCLTFFISFGEWGGWFCVRFGRRCFVARRRELILGTIKCVFSDSVEESHTHGNVCVCVVVCVVDDRFA